jgi:hypothetical protein
MASPFPGMDPYLEQPAFWSSFHTRLIVALADAIAPMIRPQYYVELETRTHKDVLPIEVKERYLEIRAVRDDRVITVIELLSPANKRPGKGRETYETKRLNILRSASHLVEIDLLRGNSQLPINSTYEPSDYYILVSIANQRPKAELYPFNLKERFPTFSVPLQHAEEAVSVDMQSVFQELWNGPVTTHGLTTLTVAAIAPRTLIEAKASGAKSARSAVLTSRKSRYLIDIDTITRITKGA